MRAYRQLALVAAAGSAALAAGCGDSGTGPVRLDVTVFANPASIPADGTTTIIAQVTTDQARPATSVPLEWSNSFGALSVTGSGARTDASGRATATLSGQGVAGVAVVTARVFGRQEVQGQVQVRIGLD